MGASASNWAAFARDVAHTGLVWTLSDDVGYPATKNAAGQRVQPFWSSASRVAKIIKTVPAYAGFHPEEMSWSAFRDEFLPGLERDGMLIGVNWSGPRATGYEVTPQEVRARVEYELSKLPPA